MEKIEQIGNNIRITGLEYFDPDLIFDCGQCFRFDKDPDGVWSGIANGRRLRIGRSEDAVTLYDCTREQFETLWRGYLGLSDDYAGIRATMDPADAHLRDAMEAGKGIRILRQDAFEVLISFIVSQNNNIGRIKKIIAVLCEACGEPIDGGFAFPTPDRLAALGEDELRGLGLGYRAPYIHDAALAVASGKLDPAKIAGMSTDTAAEALCEVRGIGPKVAACVLLFGFGKDDAFPMDVWVKRLMAAYYPGDRDGSRFGRYAGIAQQYLFYYERWKKEGQNFR